MNAALPNWPAALKRADAARYCSLSVAKFEEEVAAGNLPMPIRLGGSERWSRRKLDEALDALAGGGGDWETRAGLRVA